MKRAMPSSLSGYFEVSPMIKAPKLKGDLVKLGALKFEFTPSPRHTEAVDFLYSSAIDYLSSKVGRNFMKIAGETVFSFHFMDDIMKKDHPYCSGPELLREMFTIERRMNQWIKYIDRYIFNIKGKMSQAIYWINFLAWTPKGTVDYHKTAMRLLGACKLKLFDKLKIACVHFLVDEIPNYLSADLFEYVWHMVSCNMYYKTKELIEFWKNYARNETGNLFDNKHLLYLVGYENQQALTFVWNNLNDLSKSENIANLVKNCDIDFVIHLLSEMNDRLQLKIFEQEGGSIVCKMMDDFVWDKYMYVALRFAGQVISNDDYYSILKAASAREENAEWSTKSEDLFRSIWKKVPIRVKNFIFDEVADINLFACIRNDPCEFDVYWLFEEASCKYKKLLLWSSNGIKMIQGLIYYEEFDYVKSLVDQTFNPEEGYIYKGMLIKEYCVEPLRNSLSQEATMEELNNEMKWYFATENEAIQYKRKFILNHDNIHRLLSWLNNTVLEKDVFRQQADFTEIDALFKWFSLSPPEIQITKKIISKEPMFTNKLKRMILEDRYDLMDELLQWCLPHESSIRRYKGMFFRLITNSFIVDIVFNLLWKNENFEYLDKYVNWAFDDESQKKSFRKSIPENCKTSCSKVWGGLLYTQKFQLADAFLKWCHFSDQEIVRYKQDLLLEIDLDYVTDRVKWSLQFVDKKVEEGENQKKARYSNIMRWFNPHASTLAELKRKQLPKNEVNEQFRQLVYRIMKIE